MDGQTGHGERMPQREAPVELETGDLKSAFDVRNAIEDLGPNLLNVHSSFESITSNQDRWLASVQSEVIDARGAALVFKEGGKIVGFVLANPEGVITQLRSFGGRDVEIIKRASERLKDKGIEHVTVRLTERSEQARKAFLAAGFVEKEITEEGDIVLAKE